MKDKLMKFDPAFGTERPYPSHAEQYRIHHGRLAWLFNPWTGDKRHPYDVGSDPFGHLIGEGQLGLPAGISFGKDAEQQLGKQCRNNAIG